MFVNQTIDDGELDSIARASALAERAKRRLCALQRMHPGDPDYDPDEIDEIEEFLRNEE